MKEPTGSTFDSHPEETKKMIEELRSWGVTVNIGEHTVGYGATSIGKPGTLSLAKYSSYSAFRHEYQHVLDDKNAGWNAVFVLWKDKKERIRREKKAYQIEIELAKEANRPDIVKRLEALLDEEIRKIKTKRID